MVTIRSLIRSGLYKQVALLNINKFLACSRRQCYYSFRSCQSNFKYIRVIPQLRLLSREVVGTSVAVGVGVCLSTLSAAVLCFSSADLNQRLLDAVRFADSSEITRLIKSGADVNCRHELGWSPLHVAAINGPLNVVKKLLDAGADPNIEDHFTNPGSMSRERNLNSLQVIFIREDEFSHRLSLRANFKDFTPLHYAVLSGDMQVIRLILEHGGDPTKENEMGHKPSDYCHDNKVKHLLEDAVGKFEEQKVREEAEERRRFPLELRLKEAIIGQETAIRNVAAAIRRKQNGWYDEDHPLVFLFLGSSGIGKTELAKQVANYLHKDIKKGFVRLDMSEYQQKHEVSKFIGAPPGYVGHEEGGQLTKQLTEFPKAVVLFDEVDKAHPDVLTAMLQLFDEGRLTDGKGKTIECKDAIFVMTSNLASEEIADYSLKLRKEMKLFPKKDSLNSTSDPEDITVSRTFKDRIIRPILKRHFRRDEFLGRINEIVYFLPFSRAELTKLVAKEMNFWATQAKKKHKIELKWDHHVVDVLSDGYDVHYGARSIKYEVERRVVTQLAMAHEQQLIQPGSVIRVVVDKATDGLLSSQEESTDSRSDEAESGHHQPPIKLQVLRKGSKATFDDMPIKDAINPFSVQFG